MVEYRNPFEKQGTPASRLRDKLAEQAEQAEQEKDRAYQAEKALRFASSYGTGRQYLSSLCKNILDN